MKKYEHSLETSWKPSSDHSDTFWRFKGRDKNQEGYLKSSGQKLHKFEEINKHPKAEQTSSEINSEKHT